MKSNFMTKEVLDSLSPLEVRIIGMMKPKKKYRVREIYASLKDKLSKSSTSVILDRLHKKGLVSREVENAKGGLRFIYTLEQNKEKFERSVVDEIIDSITRKFGSKAIVYFNDSLKKRK